MSGTDLAAHLVGSLAWPLALLSIAWVLRSELRGLVRRLEKVRHKETEAVFAQDVERVSNQVALDQTDPKETDQRGTDMGPRPPSRTERPAVSDEVQDLAAALADYPAAAVLAAWQELEIVVRRKAAELGINTLEDSSVMQLVRLLGDRTHVSESDVGAIMELRRLRNEVAHGQVLPNSATAQEYATAISRILSRMGKVGGMEWGT